MSFQISALPESQFQDLFELSESDLASMRSLRVVADKKPGFPCRISLTDAEIGEELLLVHYLHQAAETPYRASHAIYIRRNVREAKLAMNEIPEVLRLRILSLRAFDENGMLVGADVTSGDTAERTIDEMFCNPRAAYIQIHFANAGCYAARADRA